MIEVYYYDKKKGVWLWDGTYTNKASADKAAKYHRDNGDRVRFKSLV